MPLMTSQSQIKGVSQSSTPNVVPEGSLWYDTSANKLKASDGSTYSNVGTYSFANSAVVSHSTTITDYTTPTAATAATYTLFNEDFTSYATQGAADAVWVSTDTSKVRVNITNDNLDFDFDTDSTLFNIVRDFTSISNTDFRLRGKIRFSALTQASNARMHVILTDKDQTVDESATNSDFIGFVLRNVSGTTNFSSIDGDATTIDAGDNSATIVWATGTDYYFQIIRTSLTAYSVEFFSDSAYTTSLGSAAGTCAATVVGLRYVKIRGSNTTTAGVLTGTIDDLVLLQVNGQADKVIDDSTVTELITNSANNPYVYVDMGAALNLCAIAIYWDGVTTTETEIKIQSSADASTWTDKRKITTSNLTDAAWNYYRFNIAGGARYIRVYGTGTSKVLAIWEIKVLKRTDAQIFNDLGIVEISASDTSLDSDGV